MSFKTFNLGCYRVKLRQTKDSYFVNILGNEWETAPSRHRREEKALLFCQDRRAPCRGRCGFLIPKQQVLSTEHWPGIEPATKTSSGIKKKNGKNITAHNGP
jgi:hypothetical protein